MTSLALCLCVFYCFPCVAVRADCPTRNVFASRPRCRRSIVGTRHSCCRSRTPAGVHATLACSHVVARVPMLWTRSYSPVYRAPLRSSALSSSSLHSRSYYLISDTWYTHVGDSWLACVQTTDSSSPGGRRVHASGARLLAGLRELLFATAALYCTPAIVQVGNRHTCTILYTSTARTCSHLEFGTWIIYGYTWCHCLPSAYSYSCAGHSWSRAMRSERCARASSARAARRGWASHIWSPCSRRRWLSRGSTNTRQCSRSSNDILTHVPCHSFLSKIRFVNVRHTLDLKFLHSEYVA